MTWSYGDWHEDRVALYDDSDDTMVCWLQKQGGMRWRALVLIKAAPELLDALKAMVSMVERDYAGFDCIDEWSKAAAAIAKAEGRE